MPVTPVSPDALAVPALACVSPVTLGGDLALEERERGHLRRRAGARLDAARRRDARRDRAARHDRAVVRIGERAVERHGVVGCRQGAVRRRAGWPGTITLIAQARAVARPTGRPPRRPPRGRASARRRLRGRMSSGIERTATHYGVPGTTAARPEDENHSQVEFRAVTETRSSCPARRMTAAAPGRASTPSAGCDGRVHASSRSSTSPARPNPRSGSRRVPDDRPAPARRLRASARGRGRARLRPLPARSHHHHLVCVACGAVEETELCAAPSRRRARRAATASAPKAHELDIYGALQERAA